MGSNGPRIFVPPYIDPVEPNIDPVLGQSVNALGVEIARRLTADGFLGVSLNSTYDMWTPARAFQHYHGAVRILTETASAELATPVTVSFDSLRPGPGEPVVPAALVRPAAGALHWFLTAPAASRLAHA
mgnify:CR=1 FL=1